MEPIEGVIYQRYWQDRRDLSGSSLELMDETNGKDRSELVAEVFCPDYSDRLYLTLHRTNVPAEVIASLIAQARVELPEPPETPSARI